MNESQRRESIQCTKLLSRRHAIIAKPIKDLWLYEPTGLELVGIRWLKNVSDLCARVSGLIAIVTKKFRLRTIAESFVRTSFSRISRVKEEKGKKKKRKEESYSSIVRRLYFSLWPREKSTLVIFRPGMLPGILIADLNVKHTATGIPVRYAWLFSVVYQNFHPLAKFAWSTPVHAYTV